MLQTADKILLKMKDQAHYTCPVTSAPSLYSFLFLRASASLGVIAVPLKPAELTIWSWVRYTQFKITTGHTALTRRGFIFKGEGCCQCFGKL